VLPMARDRPGISTLPTSGLRGVSNANPEHFRAKVTAAGKRTDSHHSFLPAGVAGQVRRGMY
jgi:hypothetical protein